MLLVTGACPSMAHGMRRMPFYGACHRRFICPIPAVGPNTPDYPSGLLPVTLFRPSVVAMASTFPAYIHVSDPVVRVNPWALKFTWKGHMSNKEQFP